MSNTLDDIRDVRQRAAAILSGAKLRQLEDAGLTVVSQEGWQKQQLVVAAMREALELVLRGARHESCKFSDDDPDPTWNCCDWNGVVTEIEKVLKKDYETLLERRLKVFERLANAVKRMKEAKREEDRCVRDSDEPGFMRAIDQQVEAYDEICGALDELEAIERE